MKIKEAAILMEGRIWTAKSHAEAIRKYILAGGTNTVGQDAQGFVTDGGKFVDRAEAMKIALAAGQVQDLNRQELFSEDLKEGT